MALIQFPLRRLIITGAFAVAVTAPAIALSAAPSAGLPAQLATCPEGHFLDPSGQCVAPSAPGMGGGEVGSIPGNPEIPTVHGIPCTGQNTGECIGLHESDAGLADTVSPKSTFGDGDETVRPNP